MTPLSVLVDEKVTSLRAEDASGSFGIFQGHAPFLTALAISVVSWRTAEIEHFCAVRGGGLTVIGNTTVTIAARETVTEDNLDSLDTEVLAKFESDTDDERTENTASVQLQLNAIRRMVSRLRSGTDAGEFR